MQILLKIAFPLGAQLLTCACVDEYYRMFECMLAEADTDLMPSWPTSASHSQPRIQPLFTIATNNLYE